MKSGDINMNKITTVEQLHKELMNIGLVETTFEEFSKYYSIDGDIDPIWKLKYRIYQKDSFFCIIFIKKNQIYSFKVYGGYSPEFFEYLVWEMVEWHDDMLKEDEDTKKDPFRYRPVTSENGKLCISDTEHTLTQAAENITKGQDYWSYYDYTAKTLTVTASDGCIGSEAHDSDEFYYHYHLTNRLGGCSFYGKVYYKGNCKEITTMEKLHEELIKIDLVETTFEEFSKYYSIQGDKDPRWKLKFKIYQKDSFFCVIFMKNDQLHSSSSYGGYSPEFFEYLVCEMVEWHDDRKDDVEY